MECELYSVDGVLIGIYFFILIDILIASVRHSMADMRISYSVRLLFYITLPVAVYALRLLENVRIDIMELMLVALYSFVVILLPSVIAGKTVGFLYWKASTLTKGSSEKLLTDLLLLGSFCFYFFLGVIQLSALVLLLLISRYGLCF